MKRLLSGIILILLIMAPSHTPEARVTGVCSDCHTMHNSQQGGAMAQTLTSSPSWGFTDDTTPNPSLLIYSCVGCHTNLSTTTKTEDNVPIVFNVDPPVNPLAGGNFHYLIADGQGDASGHNVVGIIGADSNFTGYIPGSTKTYSGNQVTCAGEDGCHGDRTAGNDELAGIKNAHHTNDTVPPLTGGSVGLSYRFLDGILGKEDPNHDWEQDNDPASHNEYKGATSPTTGTISSLCAKCHGDFHSSTGVGSSSPWLRHPTDRVLKGSGEYAIYTTYSMTAPVARPDPDSESLVTTAVTPGTDIIMCLSCHRAHASPYYKMIRWNYRDWPGTIEPTGSKGCATCHTSKD